MAMKWHPDRNPVRTPYASASGLIPVHQDDKEAAEAKFKEVLISKVGAPYCNHLLHHYRLPKPTMSSPTRTRELCTINLEKRDLRMEVLRVLLKVPVVLDLGESVTKEHVPIILATVVAVFHSMSQHVPLL